jgi:1-deoxy-D-xylulose-5-phosphate reductoisomerase
MAVKRKIIVLGITGSIGKTALRGCRLFQDSLEIVGASCHSHIDEALKLCIENKITNLCITGDFSISGTVSGQEMPSQVKIWTNLSDMLQALSADMVLNGIAGSPGLKASFEVMDSHSDLALANKESVVLGGHVLFDYAKKTGCKIIPVDSEHSALDELIMAHKSETIEKLVITASGGPFRDRDPKTLSSITPEQAIKHPTWKMGHKISIDSSTLANKGLEVIEAHYLFGFDASHIEVVIHPQSVVHSMVRTSSGQVYAQMSPPDMVFPIMRALMWPKVDRLVGSALDFTNLDLTFRKLDPVQFPFVASAFECVRLEGAYPIAYNAANEVAVKAFMEKKILYTQIYEVVQTVLEKDWSVQPKDLEEILEIQQKVFASVRL